MKKLLLCFTLALTVCASAACGDDKDSGFASKESKEESFAVSVESDEWNSNEASESTEDSESKESSQVESSEDIESSEEVSSSDITEEESEAESQSLAVSDSEEETESTAPVISEDESEAESIAPVTSEDESEEESIAPVISEDESEVESTAPAISEDVSEEESSEAEGVTPPPPASGISEMLNQQDRDYHGFSAEELDAYFEGALITGDSVTNGLKIYTQNHEAILNGAYFHTGASYGFNNAVAAVTPTSQHPLFRGQRSTIWSVASTLGSTKVFIGFGLNDFGYSNTARIETCLDRIVSNLRSVNSDIEIIFLSSGYFTRNGEVCRPELSDYRTNERQRSHNQFVLEYCNKNGFDYIDVTHCFSDAQGYLRADITLDNYCHPQIGQYTAWRDILYSYAANKMLGTYQNPPRMQ